VTPHVTVREAPRDLLGWVKIRCSYGRNHPLAIVPQLAALLDFGADPRGSPAGDRRGDNRANPTTAADTANRAATGDGQDVAEAGTVLATHIDALLFIAAAEVAGYDLLLTTDQNLKYQQNLANRMISVVVLRSTSWPRIQKHVDAISNALSRAAPGSYEEVSIP
jgi:hypothetical protein